MDPFAMYLMFHWSRRGSAAPDPFIRYQRLLRSGVDPFEGQPYAGLHTAWADMAIYLEGGPRPSFYQGPDL